MKNEHPLGLFRTNIDFLTIRVRGYDSPLSVIAQLLLLDPELFQAKAGQYRYRHALYCNHISVFYGGTKEMGFCIQLTGAGCREYCRLLNDLYAVFDLLCRANNDVAVTRLDIAIDDYDGLLDLKQISALASESIRTKLGESTDICRKALRNNAAEKGRTIYFGSSASDYHIRIYDKAAQTKTAGHWVRVEQQLRHKVAGAFGKALVEKLGDCKTGEEKQAVFHELGAGLLLQHLAFIESGGTNKSRAKLLPWWEAFLSTNDSLKLKRESKLSNYRSKEKWVREKVSRMLSALTMILGTDWLLDVLSDGIRCNQKQNSGYAGFAAEYLADGNTPMIELTAESEDALLYALSESVETRLYNKHKGGERIA